MDALTKIARKNGVAIAYGARALSLIADDDGVKGVRVKYSGKTVEVRAKGTVALIAVAISLGRRSEAKRRWTINDAHDSDGRVLARQLFEAARETLDRQRRVFQIAAT